MLPLDLHVLGLPLAFILSQDQTLRCKNFEFYVVLKVIIILRCLSFFFLNLSKNFIVNQIETNLFNLKLNFPLACGGQR